MGEAGAGRGEGKEKPLGRSLGAEAFLRGMSRATSSWANAKTETRERGKEDAAVPHWRYSQLTELKGRPQEG